MTEQNEGINLLARVMQKRTQDVAAGPSPFDFGEIQDDFSLLLNSFPVPIPATDYLVCRCLTMGKKGSVMAQTVAGQGAHGHGPSGGHSQYSGSGEHSHPATEGGHTHDIPLPPNMESLKPKDRVLAVWAGNDAVVIDVIMAGSACVDRPTRGSAV